MCALVMHHTVSCSVQLIDRVIFDWAEKVGRIRYFLGWKAEDAPQHYDMEGPRAELELEDIGIYTVNSHLP